VINIQINYLIVIQLGLVAVMTSISMWKLNDLMNEDGFDTFISLSVLGMLLFSSLSLRLITIYIVIILWHLISSFWSIWNQHRP